MALYLIRHGRPQITAGVCYGRLDIPAEPVDVASLRARLPAQFICQSSPLQRCRQLAQALHTAPRFDDRLQEIDFGQWEGRNWNEIGAAVLDAWIASGYAALHGGESLAQLADRASAWADAASGLGQDVVAVTHAGVIRTLLAQQQGWTVDAMLNYPLDFGSITQLDWKP